MDVCKENGMQGLQAYLSKPSEKANGTKINKVSDPGKYEDTAMFILVYLSIGSIFSGVFRAHMSGERKEA